MITSFLCKSMHNNYTNIVNSIQNYIKFYLILIAFLYCNMSIAQGDVLDKKISLSLNNSTIIEALEIIEKQEGYFFSYNRSEINTKTKFKKTFKNVSLSSILNFLFKNYRMRYESEEELINIRKEGRKGKLMGSIKDSKGYPIPYASIFLKNSNYGTSTKENGFFSSSVPIGKYSLIVQALGFESYQSVIEINSNKTEKYDIVLKLKNTALGEVVIKGKSIAKIIAEQPIKINTIDAKKFKIQSVGVADILKTVPGVVVRRSGGLGSATDVNLNGLTGNAVRISVDGFPIEYLGGGFDLSNIPVSNINRLEVYKGVVPADKAIDALGGGVNIVSKKIDKDVLETSYEIGSFNTRRLSLLAGKKINDKISLSFDGFYNHSNNDYKMNNVTNIVNETFIDQFNGEVRTQSVSEVVNNVERFNNMHKSYFAQIGIQFSDLKWADELTFKSNISYTFNEIQTLDITRGTATEGYFGERRAFNGNLNYKKGFFNNKLNLKYTGVISNAIGSIIRDSLNTINWNREIIVKNNEDPIDTETEFYTTAHRLGIGYQLNKQHKISLNDFYARSKIFRRDFIDPFRFENFPETNINLIPSFFIKNIGSVEISSNWFDKSLSTVVFGKYYFYDAYTVNEESPTVLNIQTKDQFTGFGLAIKYAFTKYFFIRASYEDAVRIPDELEVYGDFNTIRSNFFLSPERSDNFNLGLDYEYLFFNGFKINTGINAFKRDTKDLIALEGGDIFKQFQNSSEVLSQGLEFNAKFTTDSFSNITFNVTKQERTYQAFNDEFDAIAFESFIGSPFPNTPFFYYNVLLNIGTKSFKKSLPNIVLYGNWYHTKAFSIRAIPSNGIPDPESLVPTQDEINIGIGYFTPNKKISFSFQINNITNSFELFDNFRVPKPNRNFQFKINYQIF